MHKGTALNVTVFALLLGNSYPEELDLVGHGTEPKVPKRLV